MAECEQVKKAEGTKIRHDWYQTETHLTINILHKNVTGLKVDCNSESLDVSFPLDSGDEYNLSLRLAHEVIPSECVYKALTSKVEIRLKKKEGFRWVKLEKEDEPKPKIKDIPYGEAASQAEASALAQSSSKTAKNWDKVVSDITDSEEFKPVGEEALQELFEKIYAEGSDEVKKAMKKSFLESDGTVLSTNWEDVKHGKVDVKPPDGVEWKKWDA